MASRVVWLGDRIALRLAAAAAEAINEATHAAAEDAASNHWWEAQRGSDGLQGQILSTPAKPEGARVVGKFGSSIRKAGFYGLFLERRQPFLRPAADRHFPKLPLLIRKGTKWT